MKPSDDAITLALGAFRRDWICSEDICSVLRHLGFKVTSRQAAAALRRMEGEARPRVEGHPLAYTNLKEYRLTDHGRADLSVKFPGIEVKVKR